MDKNLALEHLAKAIASHIKWVGNIKLLVAGEAVEATIELNADECGVGLWYKEEGQKLRAIKTIPADSMNLIESLHNKIHEVYANIHPIYFDAEKKSLLKRLIQRKKKVDPKEVEMAKAHLKEIEKISFELIEELQRLERRAWAFPQSDFELL